MDVHLHKSQSLRDELREHSRYIRDTLAPLLAREPELSKSDDVLLRSIFKRLESLHLNLDLLRYSRIEKALMVIAATGTSTWPMDLVGRAEELIQKWEDKLGPLKNLRSDPYAPGGRLEGLIKIGKSNQDDDEKSAWSVVTRDMDKSHNFGSLDFQVGDWWLKPAAAYRDGIIDKNTFPITADDNVAYAIVVSGEREKELQPNGRFKYHASLDDPGALKLSRTMTTDTPKIVRVLRSWKLRSPLAPKAGLRYDGLYKIESFGILPPNKPPLFTISGFSTTFTLTRLPSQPSLTHALQYPTSDQFDDYRDYQRLKNLDHGEDFAILREIARTPKCKVLQPGEEVVHDDGDGGYFSRRGSKQPSRKTPQPGEEIIHNDGDSGYFSRRNSKQSSRINSVPENIYAVSNRSNSIDDAEYPLVAEGTPSSTTPTNDYREAYVDSSLQLVDPGETEDDEETEAANLLVMMSGDPVRPTEAWWRHDRAGMSGGFARRALTDIVEESEGSGSRSSSARRAA